MSSSSRREPPSARSDAKRVCLLGATGTIGRATARALVARGYEVVCLVRRRGSAGRKAAADAEPVSVGGTVRYADVTDVDSLRRDGFAGERFDAVVSCLASRTGSPKDAWAIDHAAHLKVLEVAKEAGVTQFVLLSALCVQQPELAFQHAKLAFEKALRDSGLTYSIVRPTAFFKSLSGQIKRLRRGKPFLLFGDGALTACKPISDADLAEYLLDCLEREDRRNRILPIGGPGKAITPREQGELLFRLLGRPPRFREVPVRLLDVIIGALNLLGRVSRAAADKAELARIGRYYATHSMLLWNPVAGRYDAAATPSTGRETLEAYYATLLREGTEPDLGDHAVF
jgi:divinyl chlorophyllide a 8-vinyl-reductase